MSTVATNVEITIFQRETLVAYMTEPDPPLDDLKIQLALSPKTGSREYDVAHISLDTACAVSPWMQTTDWMAIDAAASSLPHLRQLEMMFLFDDARISFLEAHGGSMPSLAQAGKLFVKARLAKQSQFFASFLEATIEGMDRYVKDVVDEMQRGEGSTDALAATFY